MSILIVNVRHHFNVIFSRLLTNEHLKVLVKNIAKITENEETSYLS